MACGDPWRATLTRLPAAFASLAKSLSPVIRHLSPLLSLALAAYCLLPSAFFLSAATGLYQVQEIKPHVFVWMPDDVIDQDGDPNFPRAGNSGFIVTPEGVAVVDTTNSPFHARELLYEIRERTDQPVRYVLNTSAAGDHALGNEVFVDQQSIIVSSAAAQARMREYKQALASRLAAENGWRLEERMRGIHVTPATQTFQDDLTLRLGGQDFRLRALLAGDDVAVEVPSAKVLFLGALYENNFFPRIGGRDVRRWIEALHEVETWDVETYVPGHGAPGGKKDVAAFRGFLEWLVAQVETRVREGKSLEQIKEEIALPQTFHYHAPDLASADVADVYRQLARGLRPGAPATAGAVAAPRGQ
jgi:glyoxylase-like metal-dependent hydrolase (beta-lactamase superfamily II)